MTVVEVGAMGGLIRSVTDSLTGLDRLVLPVVKDEIAANRAETTGSRPTPVVAVDPGADRPAHIAAGPSGPAAPCDRTVIATTRPHIDPRAQTIADRLLGIPTETRWVVVDETGAEHELSDMIEVGRRDRPDRPVPSITSITSITRICSAHRTVSRRHCRIERTDAGVRVVDLHSANGTAIVRDGIAIEVTTGSLALADGDMIATNGGLRPFATLRRSSVVRGVGCHR